MNKLLKRTLVAAVAAGTALAFAPAHAYVMASSMLNMTDFVIKGSDGNVLSAGPGGSFSFLTFTGSANQSVQLTGFAGISNSASSSTGPIDFPAICLGSACNPILPENSLPKLLAPPVSGNYSAADQYEAGAPISGLPGFPGIGANIGNGTYVGLDTGTVFGSAEANNNLNSSFTFALAQSTGLTFEFDLDAFLQVAISSDEIAPGFATAAVSMSFTIIDLSTGLNVFNFNPDIFGTNEFTLSLNAPLPGNFQLVRDTGGPVAFSATTAALTAGTLYQASFRMTTEADAERFQVPEPTTLGLVGLGLLAAGFGARRRSKLTQ